VQSGAQPRNRLIFEASIMRHRGTKRSIVGSPRRKKHGKGPRRVDIRPDRPGTGGSSTKAACKCCSPNAGLADLRGRASGQIDGIGLALEGAGAVSRRRFVAPPRALGISLRTLQNRIAVLCEGAKATTPGA
jgi:hypothetical protein